MLVLVQKASLSGFLTGFTFLLSSGKLGKSVAEVRVDAGQAPLDPPKRPMFVLACQY